MNQQGNRPKQPAPEEARAADRIREQMEESLAPIDTAGKAEAVVEKIVEDTQGVRAEAVTTAQQKPESVEAAADSIGAAAQSQQDEVARAAATIETTAAEAAALEDDDDGAAETIERAIHEHFWYEDPEDYRRPRRLLLDAFLRHRSIPYLQRLDAELFLWANVAFPHPPALNRFFRWIALIFRNGWGWQIGLLLCLPFRPHRVWPIMQWAVPSIYLAAFIVEQPVKAYFRRRRPFLRIVRSVIIGARPSSWSFPSGHAAAAFAGGHALSKLVPGLSPLWYAIAGLVGFCRAYLGAHYPSDILIGGLLGAGITEVAFWLLRKLGLKRP